MLGSGIHDKETRSVLENTDSIGRVLRYLMKVSKFLFFNATKIIYSINLVNTYKNPNTYTT